MSTITPTVLVTADSSEPSEVMAVAGFLAGYCGATRTSYATDLRIFAGCCHEGRTLSPETTSTEPSERRRSALVGGEIDSRWVVMWRSPRV